VEDVCGVIWLENQQQLLGEQPCVSKENQTMNVEVSKCFSSVLVLVFLFFCWG
jgi:hypothetical protein